MCWADTVSFWETWQLVVEIIFQILHTCIDLRLFASLASTSYTWCIWYLNDCLVCTFLSNSQSQLQRKGSLTYNDKNTLMEMVCKIDWDPWFSKRIRIYQISKVPSILCSTWWFCQSFHRWKNAKTSSASHGEAEGVTSSFAIEIGKYSLAQIFNWVMLGKSVELRMMYNMYMFPHSILK